MSNSMTAKNRQTGTEITVVRYEDGNYVSLVCEDHGSVCDFDSFNQAKLFKASPAEWCEECAVIVFHPDRKPAT